MRSLLFGVLLLVLPVFAGPPEPNPPAITLYVHFEQEPPAPVVQAIRDEVQAIMLPMGAQFEWRSLDAADGRQTAASLAVITFRGKCRLDQLWWSNSEFGPLGWTYVTDGTILHYSDVDCDRVRGFLKSGLLGIRPHERDAAFGRALARVTAHELYHIFANTKRHGHEGIAKGAYSVRNLLDRNFQFDADQAKELHSGAVPLSFKSSLMSK